MRAIVKRARVWVFISVLFLSASSTPSLAAGRVPPGGGEEGRRAYTESGQQGISKANSKSGQKSMPFIPETWDDLRTLEVPLANPSYSPVEVTWEYYYRVPWRPIYRSYPVYAPGHEPAGYMEWLKQQAPEVLWGIDAEGA